MTTKATPRTALITGGAGFIGSHLAGLLVAEGHRVRVLDNLATGAWENLPAGVEFLEGDIRDAGAVARAVAGCDWVFHLAALVSVPESFARPEECEAINARATRGILEASAAAGVARFLFASTCAVYGNVETLPVREDAPLDPLSPYAATKRAGEDHCREIAGRTSLEAVAFRFFNVYGPRQRADSPYSGVIAKFVDAARRGEAPTIHGDGGQTRDFVHVADVASCLLRCAEAVAPFAPGLAFNVGTGRATSLLELWKAVERAAGLTLPPRFAPVRQGDIRHSLADVTKVRSFAGWEAARTLDEGIGGLV